MVLPAPIADLLVHGLWHELVAQTSWKLVKPLFDIDYPPATWSAQVCGQYESPSEEDVTGEDIATIIVRIRNWADIVLGTDMNDDDLAEERLSFIKTISWLQVIERQLSSRSVLS